MSARTTVIALAAGAVLSACGSSRIQYRKDTPQFGFTDQPRGGGVFQITFADTFVGGREAGVEPYSPQPGDLMLLHAAEIAAAHGYTFFTVTDLKGYLFLPPERQRDVYFSAEWDMVVQEETVACFAQNPNPLGLTYKAADVVAALGRNTWLANMKANALEARLR
jgi:hypothetical protein